MNLSQFVSSMWSGSTSAGQNARRIIKIIFLLFLFVILFRVVPVNEVITALAAADVSYLIPGMLLAYITSILGALQLKLLIRKSGINLNVLQILEINLLISFYLIFLPGTLVGGGMRWYKFSKAGGKAAESLVAVIFNRFLETFLVIVMGFGFWLLSGGAFIQDAGLGLLFLMLVTILLWFFITRSSKWFYSWLEARKNKIKNSVLQKLLEKFKQIVYAVSVYAEFSFFELALIILVGITKLLVGVLSLQFLAMSVDIFLSYINMGWINSIVSLTTLLPFSISGLGYREVSLVAILSTFGISANLALAFSFLIFARNLLLGLTGGVIEAWKTIRLKYSI